MKINVLYTLIAVCLFAVIAMGSSGGRATAADSGNTGAPGDAGATCITCHGNNAAIELSLDIAMTDGDGNAIDKYVPGTIYNGSVTLNVIQGAPAAHGFQIVAINAALDENGPSVNTFSDPDADVQIATPSNGRQYAEHNGPNSTDNIFEFKWTAPAEGSGTVTFYSCGNGVDLGGSTAGDNAACSTFEMPERPVSLFDLNVLADLSVAPNPVQDQINLTVASQLTGEFNARVFSASGQEVLQRTVTLNGGNNRFTFPAHDLTAGIYFLQLSNGHQGATLRVVKR